MSTTFPSYLNLHQTGILQRRSETATRILACCTLCPRQCKVDRLSGEQGYCRSGCDAMVADFSAHFGEEQPLVGENGSGTIFFSGCNLLCLFCQNYEISRLGHGVPASDRQLAEMMFSLQQQGCHNINLVTPTHVVPQILAALIPAIDMGLRIPLVYNSSGYEMPDTLQLLDGIIDIYMPDFKFWDPESSARYANAPDYPERARSAVTEMYRQVGDLVVDSSGIARRGLLIRHLVMPEGLSETERILGFIADQISKDSYVNVMDQYRPCGRAGEIPPVDRPLKVEEYHRAMEAAERAGITRLDKRDFAEVLRRLYHLRKK